MRYTFSQRLKPLSVLSLSLLLSACASHRPQTLSGLPPLRPEGPAPTLSDALTPVVSGPLSALPGFTQMDAQKALSAIKATCHYKRLTTYNAICDDLRRAEPVDEAGIRAFISTHFEAQPVEGSGLMTAYYVPEYQASRLKSAEFSQPVRTKPDDLLLVDGALMTPAQSGKHVPARKADGLYLPYYNRSEIEDNNKGDSGFYMRPEDFFFMQIQGSGYISLEDGATFLATYSADNGLSFSGIAKPMIEQGLISKDKASGETIRQWLKSHSGLEAQNLMNQDARYVFFNIVSADHEPLGASGLALPAGAAIAIDPNFHAYGELFYINADAPTLNGAFNSYNGVVSALDTGGAIKGNIRADFYMGRGDQAGIEAGRVRHRLKMWKLVPKV